MLVKSYELAYNVANKTSVITMKFADSTSAVLDFIVRLHKGSSIVDLRGAELTIGIIKPDNTVETQYHKIDTVDYYVTLIKELKDVPGISKGYIMLQKGNDFYTIGPISYQVSQSQALSQLASENIDDTSLVLLQDILVKLKPLTFNNETYQTTYNMLLRGFDSLVINNLPSLPGLETDNNIASENTRQAYEEARQAAEELRVNNETLRKINENERIQNESLRQHNEELRMIAYEKYIKAIDEINTDFSGVYKQMQTQVDNLVYYGMEQEEARKVTFDEKVTTLIENKEEIQDILDNFEQEKQDRANYFDELIEDVTTQIDIIENTIEGNEQERQNIFEANEQERQNIFDEAETLRNQGEGIRQSTFETNEQERQNIFDEAETLRNQGEGIRQSIFEENEAIRNQGEGIRQSTFEANESGRQLTFSKNEQERQNIFNTNEAAREESEKKRQEAFEFTELGTIAALLEIQRQQEEKIKENARINRRQDILIQGLLAENKDKRVSTQGMSNTSTPIELDYAVDNGLAIIDYILGSTHVNNAYGPRKMVLQNDINVESNGDIKLEATIDGGVVEAKIEGNTLVNVCDQEEPIVITKSYTVEGTNHVPLQGEYDGKARPVVYGNTLVNHNVEYDESIIAGEKLDNIQGTEILNLKGTPGCEIKVDIDGHTAINLSTKKEDILCKSFDSASGNEIKLVAEENSVSDLVIQGNTMVNLLDNKRFDGQHMRDMSYDEVTKTYSATIDGYLYPSFMIRLNYSLDVNKTYTVIFKIKSSLNGKTFKYGLCKNNGSEAWNVTSSEYTLSNSYQTYITTLPKRGTDLSALGFGFLWNLDSEFTGVEINIKDVMVFEGDLTQTPELIPTEYVEGLKSSFEDKMVNLFNKATTTDGYEFNGISGEILNNNEWFISDYIPVKPNTTYSKSGLSSTAIVFYDSSKVMISVTNVAYQFLTPDGCCYVRINGHLTEKGTAQIEEGAVVTEYIPYGLYKAEVKTVGKNLFDGLLEYGDIASGKDSTNTQHVKSVNFIKIKSNTVYTLSATDILYNESLGLLIAYYDGNKEFIKHQNMTENVQSPSNAVYCRIRTRKSTTENISLEEMASIQLQLEEGSTATEYEPYFGTSKTIYLNTPLLEGDELVYKDGQLYHYHKMAQTIIDGSNASPIWIDEVQSAIGTNTIMFASQPSHITNIVDDAKLISDNISYTNVYNTDTVEGIYRSGNAFRIRINRSRLSTQDVAGFKQWLSENPLTLVYELAEPLYEPIGTYGKVILDGSEDWKVITGTGAAPVNTNYIRFYIDISDIKMSDYAILNCDKFTIKPGINLNTAETCISSHGSVGRIDVCINKSGLPTPDVDGFKQWLRENPVTVIYELAEPQYIDEDMRFNITSTSTIEYQSSVPVANTTFLPYRNELPLLESSTQYRVTFDCDVEGLELMVSLGGTSQTITSGLHNELSFITPSLQTDGKLTIDGYGIAKIDNVLITKGDMEYKYFEGLKSGFENRYIPVDIAKDFENLIINNGANNVVDVSISNIKPNTKYTLYAPTLEGNHIALRFRIPNGGELSTAVNSNISFTNPMIIETYDDTYDFSNVILRYYCDLDKGTSFSTKDIKIFEGDWSYLVGYFNELSEEDWNNSETYKATIKIKNSNAPIFGKGGRL